MNEFFGGRNDLRRIIDAEDKKNLRVHKFVRIPRICSKEGPYGSSVIVEAEVDAGLTGLSGSAAPLRSDVRPGSVTSKKVTVPKLLPEHLRSASRCLMKLRSFRAVEMMRMPSFECQRLLRQLLYRHHVGLSTDLSRRPGYLSRGIQAQGGEHRAGNAQG